MRRAAAVAVLLVAGARTVAAQGDVDSLAARVHRLADAYVAGYFERHPDEATLDGVAGGRHGPPPPNTPRPRGRRPARRGPGGPRPPPRRPPPPPRRPPPAAAPRGARTPRGT